MNLNPTIDVPEKPECEGAFKRAVARYSWLKVEPRGFGSHTGRGTSWAGAYKVYELIDPMSPNFGMTGRVAEAAEEIEAEIYYAIADTKRDNGQWW